MNFTYFLKFYVKIQQKAVIRIRNKIFFLRFLN